MAGNIVPSFLISSTPSLHSRGDGALGAVCQPSPRRRHDRAGEKTTTGRDRSGGNIIEVGNDPLAVKESLVHGQFGPWLSEFGWGERMAENYTSVEELPAFWPGRAKRCRNRLRSGRPQSNRVAS